MTQRRIKATDLYSLAACDRLVYLNHNGEPDTRLSPSAFDEWIFRRGLAFEEGVVRTLPVYEPTYPRGDLERGFEATLRLMREGVPYLFQGVLLHDDLVGMPDLMQRVEGPSSLGDHHYRAIDVKLATAARDDHRWQVMFYTYILEQVQGVRAEGGLFLRVRDEASVGDGDQYAEEAVPYDDAEFQTALAEVRRLAGGDEPDPFIKSACKNCAWRELCIPLAQAADDVSLLPGLHRPMRDALHQRGLRTVRQIAQVEPDDLTDIPGIGPKRAQEYVVRARALTEDRPVRIGSPGLPEPSSNECFFDVESVPGEGIIYLLGVLVPQSEGWAFEYDMARSADEEPAMWESFLRRMDALGGPVYHYGVYERTAINQLIDRHSPEDPRALALLDRCIDLHKTIRGSFVLPLHSDSLKSVAPWLGYQWSGATQQADDSIVEYINYLDDGDETHLDHILHYNEDDVRATLLIRDWLLDQR